MTGMHVRLSEMFRLRWGIVAVAVVAVAVFVLVVALLGYCDPYDYAGTKNTYHYTGHHGIVGIPPQASPLLHLTGVARKDIVKKEWAEVSYDGTPLNTTLPCAEGKTYAKIKIRGNSPLYPYTPSYKIKYYRCTNGDFEKDKNGGPTNYYTLRVGFVDETTLRDGLAQWIWDRIGNAETDVMSCNPIYLAIGGEYIGAYQNCTSPGKDVIVGFADDDVLFKLDPASDSDWPEITQHEIKEPSPDDVGPEYVDFLKDVVKLYHENKIENIDVESYARRFVFQELSHDTDGSYSVYVHYKTSTQKFSYPIVWDYDMAFASPQQQCVLPPTARPDGFEFRSWDTDTWQTRMIKHAEVKNRINSILRTLNLELDAFNFSAFDPALMRLDLHKWLHKTCYPYLFDGVDKSTYDLFSTDGLHYEPLLRDQGGHIAFDLPQNHEEAVNGLKSYIVNRERVLRQCQLDTCGSLDRKSWGPLFIALMTLISITLALLLWAIIFSCMHERTVTYLIIPQMF